MTADGESYIIQQAAQRARLLSITAGFPHDQIEDLRQELLLDYLRRLPKYDPRRGPWDGFVRGVMRNQSAVLTWRRCRRANREVLAADLITADTEEPEFATIDVVYSQDPTNEFAVSIDVRRVLRQLPGDLQLLAHLLAELPVREVCLAIGKSRSWVYQMIRKLRLAFIRAGLDTRSRGRR